MDNDCTKCRFFHGGFCCAPVPSWVEDMTHNSEDSHFIGERVWIGIDCLVSEPRSEAIPKTRGEEKT